MTFSPRCISSVLLTCLVAATLATANPARGQSAAAPDPTDAGKAVFKRANCMGCHKWHGNGGGGYGGDALSLRKTELTREQIIETVGCGRPGTGMPFFLRGAYDAIKCYDQVRQDMAGSMPPEATGFLRPAEIEAVADYVLAHVKGKGEPTYAECTSFFTQDSRVCNTYKTEPSASSENAAKDR